MFVAFPIANSLQREQDWGAPIVHETGPDDLCAAPRDLRWYVLLSLSSKTSLPRIVRSEVSVLEKPFDRILVTWTRDAAGTSALLLTPTGFTLILPPPGRPVSFARALPERFTPLKFAFAERWKERWVLVTSSRSKRITFQLGDSSINCVTDDVGSCLVDFSSGRPPVPWSIWDFEGARLGWGTS